MPTPHVPNEAPEPAQRAPNRLAAEKSPYLLQHAHNPVDWYPWGEEAWARARAEGKPIFLSVGYATCHWCHVMERESFEDPAVARLMNELFVNIKVDREERPDVDRVYMTFLQATSGGGGWPMSVWLTPELKPFFAGTYFPSRGGYGRPAFADVLRQLARAWRDERAVLEGAAERAVAHLRAAVQRGGPPPETLDPAALDRGYAALRAAYDPHHGGFGGPPKFPLAAAHGFLLRYAARTGQPDAAPMVLDTLRAMAAGGIHDHLGGGFHRYAVDGQWHVPHFEKMLYDQAQLALSYLEAFQLSGDAAFAQTARGICDYVLTDLLDEQTGAFCAAEDADSPVAHPAAGHAARAVERREGAFYTWTREEIEALLEPADAALFCDHYGVAAQGNAEDPHGELAGQNVLHAQRTIAETARRNRRAEEAVAASLARARERLRAHRARRPRPLRDDKIITAYNGLMIGALARAARVLEEPRYLQAAHRAAQFIVGTLYDAEADALYRRYRAGQRAFVAGLEDHAALIFGLLELYDAELALRWLVLAEQLADRALRRFADRVGGGFFCTAGDDASIVLRLKDDHDGSEPSGSSLIACDLLRLAPRVGRPELADVAAETIRSATLTHMPQMQVALDLLTRPRPEVVLRGEGDDAAVRRLAAATARPFVPELTLLLADEAFLARYGERLPHLKAMPSGAPPAAYLCEDQSCKPPVTDPAALAALLSGAETSPGME